MVLCQHILTLNLQQTLLMHSFLLNQFEPQEALEKIIELTQLPLYPKDFGIHPDIIIINPKINEKTTSKKASIKIETVRNLQTLLSKRPLRLPLQIAVIWNADTLTLAAQQSFLKLLEEPQQQTNIFLITNNFKSLLPTIQSRCQIISAIKTQSLNPLDKSISKELEKLSQMGPIKRMEVFEQYAVNREKSLEWLENTIRNLRLKMVECRLQGTQKSLVFILKNAQIAYNDIKRSINIKLSLDNLAITWDKRLARLDARTA